LPSEMVVWQPEFTDKTLSRKTGAVQNTDALEKQINERLEGVLSRWLLLKNNVMPEAATGTTAEK
ncbi:hypothetical protein PO563_23410, partial [Escherichia coli]